MHRLILLIQRIRIIPLSHPAIIGHNLTSAAPMELHHLNAPTHRSHISHQAHTPYGPCHHLAQSHSCSSHGTSPSRPQTSSSDTQTRATPPSDSKSTGHYRTGREHTYVFSRSLNEPP